MPTLFSYNFALVTYYFLILVIIICRIYEEIKLKKDFYLPLFWLFALEMKEMKKYIFIVRNI